MLKKIGAGILTFAMLLVSMAFLPVVSAAADEENAISLSDNEVNTYDIDGLTSQKIREIEVSASYVRSLPDTVKKAPYMGLVTADDETKTVVLRYIDNFSMSDSEKSKMKNSLQDIWSRVPDNITEEDYPVIQNIGDAVTNYVEETYWADKQSIQWVTKAHQGLIRAGVNLVYKNSKWAGWAAVYAPKPDSTDTGADRYWYHYYNPGINSGGAPSACSACAGVAKTYYSKGSSYREKAFNNLGIASHYLSDVGNPMHTGFDYNTFKKGKHINYESYVDANWNSGCTYSQYANKNTRIKSISSPSQATKDLAEFSFGYYRSLWGEINSHPDNFNTTTTQYITAKVLRETATYNAGLAKYIKS